MVLEVLQHGVGYIQVLPAENGKLARLVITRFVHVHVESELQRPVKHVRLGETKADAACQVSDAGLYLKRFAETQKVVRRIVNADEGAFQPADAAVQPDAVLAFFLNLESEVDQPVFLVQFAVGDIRIVRLQLVEVSQLIQAQQAQFPKPGVIDVALFERDLAADYLVTGRSVALEFDAANVELLAFVHVDVEEDEFLLVVKTRFGYRSEIDVTLLAIGLAQVFQSLRHFFFAEDLSIFDGEEISQGFRVRHSLVVLEGDGPQSVAVAFLDRHSNVDGLASAALQKRDMHPLVSGIVNLGLRLVHNDFKIAAILVFVADAFGIFVELGGIVGSGKDVFQKDRVGHANGTQVLIGLELDLAYLDLGSFFDDKRNSHGGGGNLPDFRFDGRKLTAMFPKQAFDGHFRLLHFGGSLLIFYRQSGLRLFEAI